METRSSAEFQFLFRLFILPIRNGNAEYLSLLRLSMTRVFILPMRNGNMETLEELGHGMIFVFILPMRNGNFITSLFVISLFSLFLSYL